MDVCAFACGFPNFVEKFLDRECRLSKGGSFREESVTDVLTACLMSYRSAGIFVDYPDELATGADMKWRFISTSNFTDFTFLVQAKRSRPDLRKGVIRANAEAKYFSLLQKSKRTKPKSKGLQLDDLCGQATAGIAPIFALYNPGRICSSIPGLSGVNLADAFQVRSLVRAWIKGGRRATKSGPVNPAAASNLQPIFGSFSSLFCAGGRSVLLRAGSGGPSFLEQQDSPTPEAAAAFARNLANQKGTKGPGGGGERPEYAANTLGVKGLLSFLEELHQKAQADTPRVPEIVFFTGRAEVPEVRRYLARLMDLP